MKDNDRLFAMRQRAEKTLDLIKQMNETFNANPDENIILTIMASNYDSFWEGWTWRRDKNLKEVQTIMEKFCSKFYASDYFDEMQIEISTFLKNNGYEQN